MIWISKVILENFQSHKYSVMEFDQGLNAIVGSTDSGKTAIFRAIKWALYNEPQGDYFVREGEDYVSVKVYFNSGVIVNRFRRKTKNGYELTYPDGEIMIFEGFGTRVPEEILEATNIRKVNFTPTENRSLNMAEQLDAPFLLSETPRVRAAAIGKLVEADVVDEALSQTNIDLRNKRRELKEAKEDLDSIRDNLKEYEYLDSLADTIEKLEEIQEKKDTLEIKLGKLDLIKENLTVIIDRKKELKVILKGLRFIKLGEEIYLKAEKYRLFLERLDGISDKLSSTEKLAVSYANVTRELSVVNNIESSISGCENMILILGQLEKISKRLSSLFMQKAEYETISQELNRLEEAIVVEKNIEKYINRLSYIFERGKNLKFLGKRINNGEKYLESLGKIEESEEIFIQISGMVDKIVILEKVSQDIKKFRFSINREEVSLEKQKEFIKNQVEKYYDFLKVLKVCPTCYRTIDINDIEGLVEHMLE